MITRINILIYQIKNIYIYLCLVAESQYAES